ncbi:MAG: hypothetical protein N2578_00065 [Bdellovibrionaceae bacterium]|nr:hypothetical protein [Pseudobdellovibrionaceae bacterium]
MNKKILIGMILTTSMSLPAFAAGSAAIRAKYTEYLDKSVKPAIFGKADAKGLAGVAKSIANDKLFQRLNLDGTTKANLNQALTGKSSIVETRLENLTALAAAREFAKSLNDASEAQSITNAADALTRTIANSILTGAVKDSKILKADELADATAALMKLETLGESVIKMDRSERDSYAAVEMKRDEILATGKKSAEEALVEAIMEVKKVNKDEAMKMVRKLKDCV